MSGTSGLGTFYRLVGTPTTRTPGDLSGAHPQSRVSEPTPGWVSVLRLFLSGSVVQWGSEVLLRGL